MLVQVIAQRHIAYVEVDVESVRRGGSCRTAACVCGWKGPERATLVMVADDAIQHELEHERSHVGEPMSVAVASPIVGKATDPDLRPKILPPQIPPTITNMPSADDPPLGLTPEQAARGRDAIREILPALAYYDFGYHAEFFDQTPGAVPGIQIFDFGERECRIDYCRTEAPDHPYNVFIEGAPRRACMLTEAIAMLVGYRRDPATLAPLVRPDPSAMAVALADAVAEIGGRSKGADDET